MTTGGKEGFLAVEFLIFGSTFLLKVVDDFLALGVGVWFWVIFLEERFEEDFEAMIIYKIKINKEIFEVVAVMFIIF